MASIVRTRLNGNWNSPKGRSNLSWRSKFETQGDFSRRLDASIRAESNGAGRGSETASRCIPVRISTRRTVSKKVRKLPLVRLR